MPTKTAGMVLSITPIAGDEKVTFAKCLNLTEGGSFILVHRRTSNHIVMDEMIRMMATRLNNRK